MDQFFTYLQVNQSATDLVDLEHIAAIASWVVCFALGFIGGQQR